MTRRDLDDDAALPRCALCTEKHEGPVYHRPADHDCLIYQRPPEGKAYYLCACGRSWEGQARSSEPCPACRVELEPMCAECSQSKRAPVRHRPRKNYQTRPGCVAYQSREDRIALNAMPDDARAALFRQG